MNRRDVTFANVLAAVRTQLTQIGGVPASQTRLAKRPVDPLKVGASSPFYVVCPSSDWSRNDGIGLVGDSELIFDGQIIIQILVREDAGEPEMSESMLTDPVIGSSGPIDLVINSLNENPCADALGTSPLMEPLYPVGLSFGQDVNEATARWYDIRIAFACKFRYINGAVLNPAFIVLEA